MLEVLTMQTKVLVQPQAIKDNAEFVGSKGSTPAYVDTAGADYASFFFAIGATDIAMVEMEVWECATSGGSYTLVTGAEFGASGLAALPIDTDDNTLHAIHLPLLGRARYLEVYMKAGDGSAGTYGAAWVVLSRLKQPAANYAARGLTGEIIV